MVGNVLTSGRLAAEALMLDTCLITRGGGPPVWDEASGEYTAPDPVTVYQGRCKVQSAPVSESSPEAGEQRLTIQRYYLHVPVGAIKYRPGDDVEILTSAHNPALPGTLFTVSGTHDKSLQTAHRLLVDEVAPRG